MQERSVHEETFHGVMDKFILECLYHNPEEVMDATDIAQRIGKALNRLDLSFSVEHIQNGIK